METHRVDRKKFPYKSIDCLLSGLLRHVREINPATASNFLDENNPNYAGLHGTRDTSAT